MNEQNYNVYIKTDDDNNIIAVNSSGFLDNTQGWIKIDEGCGDKYLHAQNYYFNMPLTDSETGVYRYKYEQGAAIENTDFNAMCDLAKKKTAKQKRIDELKALLAEHDYIGIKIATGRATADEYSSQISLMRQWAEEINTLEQ